MTLPVFGGISGSNSTRCSMRAGGRHSAAAIPASDCSRCGGTRGRDTRKFRRIDHDALRGIGERHAETAELVDDAKVHRLLQVQQGIDFWLLHEERQLELEPGALEAPQMTAVEARIRLLAHDAFHEFR